MRSCKRVAASALVALAACGAGPAAAQSVSLQGTMGASRAVLVIDGKPRVLAVGESAGGVRLAELRGDEARVEHGGQSAWLRVGAAQVRLGSGAVAASTREIVIPMGQGGHYFVDGSINGRAVRFMVDTGATAVSLSVAQARQLGLDFERGERGMSSTAGGVVPVWGMKLGSVRVGGVEVANVQAVVGPADMPFVLLGNSFLNRFQMRRENDVMRMELR